MGLIEIIVLGIFFVAGCLLSAFERYGWTILVTLVVLVGSWFLFDPVQTLIQETGWRTILLHYVPLYLAAGVGVALGKWFIHVFKTASAIREAKETFNPNHIDLSTGLKQILDGDDDAIRRAKFISHWNRTVADRHSIYFRDYVEMATVNDYQYKDWSNPEIITNLLTPKAKKHVDDISYWIFFWPFVVVSTAFKDFFVKIVKHIARLFDALFGKLSRLLISNATKDI